MKAVVLLLVACLYLASAACPCKNQDLCKPLTTPPRKEILAFQVTAPNWQKYDWDVLTTVAVFTNLDSEMLCHAHEKGVRVVLSAEYPVTQLSNATAREEWIKQQVELVQSSYTDGLNIDFESPIGAHSADKEHLTELVRQTYKTFKALNPSYQITFDVAWSPACIDVRCFDYKGLSDYTDFLVVMDYDMRSQIFGPCIASANSPVDLLAAGLHNFTKLGIEVDKLVIGVPWYGYKYECLALNEDNICTIPKVPFRGVDCSDAAGRQFNFVDIMAILESTHSESHFNFSLTSPFFDYKENGKTYQMWYDDLRSLEIKYKYASTMHTRGLAMWNVDAIDYSDTTAGKKQREEWFALLKKYF
eukprot:TRINITY_DN3570_c0_g3_i1.p1 TRINITY_DN3570_c0_g3~~TRINITY_DN3570_c0_g3_i1.p1  ORF type:complete len:360 (+),score=61.54 TRINITY_DN3570_c0_g3_i1:105-1184(+)